MASNREERRLQRQRGAGRHQVQDVDFGSPFPTAAVVQSRVTRSGGTPQPQPPIQSSRRKTPAPQDTVDLSNNRSMRKRSTPTPVPTANDANTSAKRRKLDAPREALTSSPVRNTRSRTTPRRDIYDLEEEPGTESTHTRTLDATVQTTDEPGNDISKTQPSQTPKSVRLRDPSQDLLNEVTESPGNAPGSSQRQRANLEGPQVPGVRLFVTPGEITPTFASTGQNNVSENEERPEGGVVRKDQSPELGYDRASTSGQASSAADEVDELSPDRPDRSRLVFQQQYSENEGEEQLEAEGIDDVEAAVQLQRTRKKRSYREELEWKAEDEDPLLDEDEENEEQAEQSDEPRTSPVVVAPPPQKRERSKASPAAQRQPKKPKPKSKATSRNSGEVIPVIVHRLTKPVLYGEDDTDADLLNEDVPFAKRSGVNAVDVLSQFCEEVIDSGLTALEEGASAAEDPTSRREYRTKLRAVEAFQEELRTRLLELTVILDADYLLNKRVRAAQKEKVRLREEVLRLRSEREKLALRMDEVRIKHESSSKEAQEKAALNTALHDIELAVSRGIEFAILGNIEKSTPRDLPILLKSLAEDVSTNSAQGGILKQVKDFNAFLERAALVLEGQA